MWKTYSANVDGLYLGNTRGSFITTSVSEISVTYGGIPDDSHFGLTKRSGVRESMYPRKTEIFNRRQITIVSIEECEEISDRLGIPLIRPEWLGANIAIRGLASLTQLSIGSRFIFPNGAGLVCEGENLPCTQVGAVLQRMYPDVPKLTARFVRGALGLRGIIAVVERPGRIEATDTAKVVNYEPPAPMGARGRGERFY